MNSDWTVVYSTDQEYKAVILREKLQEAGIESNEVSKKGSELVHFIGQIDIYVPKEDFDKASEIINQLSDL